MNVPDTSVLVPALAGWHPHHRTARSRLSRKTTAVGHCVVESYSVLTRLPEPHRLTSAVASEALTALVARALVLDEDAARDVPQRLAAAGIQGGSAYDGLIALTAKHHGATVVTFDAKASRTYQALGIDFELLDPTR